MDTYCVFGHPIELSKSPWIHAIFEQLTDQHGVCHKTLAPLDGFASSLHQGEVLVHPNGAPCCSPDLLF